MKRRKEELWKGCERLNGKQIGRQGEGEKRKRSRKMMKKIKMYEKK